MANLKPLIMHANRLLGAILVDQELVSIDDLDEAINRGKETAEIKQIAVKSGMKTLHQDSLLKVKVGVTTPGSVVNRSSRSVISALRFGLAAKVKPRTVEQVSCLFNLDASPFIGWGFIGPNSSLTLRDGDLDRSYRSVGAKTSTRATPLSPAAPDTITL